MQLKNKERGKLIQPYPGNSGMKEHREGPELVMDDSARGRHLKRVADMTVERNEPTRSFKGSISTLTD